MRDDDWLEANDHVVHRDSRRGGRCRCPNHFGHLNWQIGAADDGCLTPVRDPLLPPPPLTIAALGDSVTVGTNCDCIAFSALYAKELSTARGSHATDCVQDQIDKRRQNIAATVAQIHTLRNGKPTAVLITGYWNVFEDGDVAAAAYPSAGFKATQKLTAEINRAIDDAAKAAGATRVELFASFTGAAAEGNVTNLLIEAGLPGLTAG